MFFFDVFFLFILLYFTETITPLPETTTTVVLPTTMTVTTTTAIADTIPNGLIDTTTTGLGKFLQDTVIWIVR